MVSRRVKRVFIPDEMAANIFKEDTQVIDGIPEDAVSVGVDRDNSRQGVWVRFSHPLFDKVNEGEVIPEYEVDIKLVERCPDCNQRKLQAETQLGSSTRVDLYCPICEE